MNNDTITNIWNSNVNQEIEKWVRPNNCGLICKVIRFNIGVQNVMTPNKSIDPNFIGWMIFLIGGKGLIGSAFSRLFIKKKN